MEKSKKQVFQTLFQPLNNMCQKLKHEEIDVCFDLLKDSIKLVWQNIRSKLETYGNAELNNFLQIDTIITQFSNENTKLLSYRKYHTLLEKCYLVKVCLSISLLECFKNEIKASNASKKDYLASFFKEKSEELNKSRGLNVFLLCIQQIEVCLQFLLNISFMEHSNKIILKESRQYIIERIEWCLNFLENESMQNIFFDQPDSGSFIQLMDIALDLISNINVDENASKREDMAKAYNIAKEQIDQILCHAMTISQIALPYDSASIKASCQKILGECDQLQSQLNKNDLNISSFNLLLDSLSDSLCSLEERVNVGVLKLLLEVFQNYDENLKKLEDICKNSANNTQRSVNDLNDLITPFDIQTERIMQIGLFAVTCSTHKHRVLRMRSCLASLESLEKELVPALSIYYLEQTKNSELHAQLLIKHWRDSINLLQNLIHLIVDPVAFTQVVIESCSDKLNMAHRKDITFDELNSVCLECDLLLRHLNISLPEIYECIPNDLNKQKKIFVHLLNECTCVVEQWLTQNDPNSHKNIQRLLKRFKLMIKYLKKLSIILADTTRQDNTNSISNDSTTQEIIQVSVKKTELPIVISQEEILKKMMSLALKSEQIRKERSILYQTPVKTVKIVAFHPKNHLVASRSQLNRSMSKTQFARKISRDSVQLDVTDILENVSNLELTC